MQLINHLEIETKEKQLLQCVTEMKIDEKVSICDERIAFNSVNKIGFLLDRITAVNEVTIGKNMALSNRIQWIRNIQYIPCCVSYMDMPFNNSIYAVQLFYRKLYEKYGGNINKTISLGLIRNLNGRELNFEEFSDYERKIADELNIFILYVKASRQLELLIDLCKNINYNYCQIKCED